MMLTVMWAYFEKNELGVEYQRFMDFVSQRKYIQDSWLGHLTYSVVTLLEVVVYTAKLRGSNRGVQGTTVTDGCLSPHSVSCVHSVVGL